MRPILSLILLLTFYLSTPRVNAADKVTGDQSVPQLKVFQRYIGDWTFTMKSNDGLEMQGEMTTRWIHGGKLVRQSWTMEPVAGLPAATGENVMTYDAANKLYRQWSLNSFGHTTTLVGKWDADSQTMTWKGQDSLGNELVTRSRLEHADPETFFINVKNADGDAISSLEGKAVRKR